MRPDSKNLGRRRPKSRDRGRLGGVHPESRPSGVGYVDDDSHGPCKSGFEEATMFHVVEASLNHSFQDRSDTTLATMSPCTRTSSEAQDQKRMERWAVFSSESRESDACRVAWSPKCFALRLPDAANFVQGVLFLVGTETAGQSIFLFGSLKSGNQLSAEKAC